MGDKFIQRVPVKYGIGIIGYFDVPADLRLFTVVPPYVEFGGKVFHFSEGEYHYHEGITKRFMVGMMKHPTDNEVVAR